MVSPLCPLGVLMGSSRPCPSPAPPLFVSSPTPVYSSVLDKNQWDTMYKSVVDKQEAMVKPSYKGNKTWLGYYPIPVTIDDDFDPDTTWTETERMSEVSDDNPTVNGVCLLADVEQLEPIDLFDCFITPQLVNDICTWTNQNEMMFHGNGEWKPMIPEELYAVMAIILRAGVIQAPAWTDYWSADYDIGWFNTVMGRDRFVTLIASLYLCPYILKEERVEWKAKSGLAYNVKPVINRVAEAFRSVYYPGQTIVVDETMVRARIRNDPLITIMPNKPIPEGYKFWSCATRFGYVLNMFLNNVVGETGQGEGLTGVVVRELTQPYHHKHHRVTCDKFFMTIDTCRGLYEGLATEIVGPMIETRAQNQLGIDVKTLKEGEWVRFAKEEDPLRFVVWRVNDKIRTFAYTLQLSGGVPTPVTTHPDRAGGPQRSHGPAAAAAYYSTSSGVDIADELLASYHQQHRSDRREPTIFSHIIITAANNAYLLFKRFGNGDLTHKEFIRVLSVSLAARGPRLRTTVYGNTEKCKIERLPKGTHKSKRRVCVVCGKKTWFFCSTCPGHRKDTKRFCCAGECFRTHAAQQGSS